jgi:hypothetical protein
MSSYMSPVTSLLNQTRFCCLLVHLTCFLPASQAGRVSSNSSGWGGRLLPTYDVCAPGLLSTSDTRTRLASFVSDAPPCALTRHFICCLAHSSHTYIITIIITYIIITAIIDSSILSRSRRTCFVGSLPCLLHPPGVVYSKQQHVDAQSIKQSIYPFNFKHPTALSLAPPVYPS